MAQCGGRGGEFYLLCLCTLGCASLAAPAWHGQAHVVQEQGKEEEDGQLAGSTSNINIRAFQAMDVTGRHPGGVNKQDDGQCWKGGVSLRIAKSFSFF